MKVRQRAAAGGHLHARPWTDSDPEDDGRARIRIAVDSAGSPAIEFLDEAGRVATRLPEARK
jgi:hypothetical protein